MITASNEIKGIDKAAVLMMSLSSKKSADVMSCLSADEQDRLGTRMAETKHVRSYVRQIVLEEVNDYIQKSRSESEPMLSLSSQEQPKDKSQDTPPLVWLEELDAADVAQMLVGERPQNIALIIAHLSSGGAARILSHLDDRTRDAVAERLINIGKVSDAAVAAVDKLMRDRVARPRKSHKESLAKILTRSRDRKEVVAEVAQAPEATPVQVKSVDDLPMLSDTRIRMILDEIDPKDIGCALVAASDDARKAVIRNVPESVASMLREMLDNPGRVKLREIEFAQASLVAAAEVAA